MALVESNFGEKAKVERFSLPLKVAGIESEAERRFTSPSLSSSSVVGSMIEDIQQVWGKSRSLQGRAAMIRQCHGVDLTSNNRLNRNRRSKLTSQIK